MGAKIALLLPRARAQLGPRGKDVYKVTVAGSSNTAKREEGGQREGSRKDDSRHR